MVSGIRYAVHRTVTHRPNYTDISVGVRRIRPGAQNFACTVYESQFVDGLASEDPRLGSRQTIVDQVRSFAQGR